MIGKTVSHYDILEKLGQGGMGVVYKALDAKLNRHVALKFLPSELTRDQEAKERFVQEAQAASVLDHPNVCTIHEIDEHDGQMFIVMGYVEGSTLRKEIQRGILDLPRIELIAAQIAEGLKAAHAKGIVHRDVKSDNVMVSPAGQVKIMDFGLAKLKSTGRITRTGTVVGTASYMSPEQARGEPVDNRTDIWSLGVVLYEMATGRLPFTADYEPAIVYSVLNEEPEDVTSIREDLPSVLDRITTRAMEKDREKRYQHVQEMLADLKSLKETPGSDATGGQRTSSRRLASTAVLPFENMSPDKEQEYFCDGMAEEIINALTRVEGLRVVARSSAFAFKGKNEDAREVGKKLDVATILEGSVRKAGNRLRITAQLINVADGYHLWSERYDRELEDVFAIQDEISQAIVNTLKVKLVGGEDAALVKRSTENLDAFNLYLKGRYFWSKRTEEGLKKGIEYFEQAIEKDPEYAVAYSGLADSYSLLCSYHILSPKDSIPEARAAATKAVELDSSLAEAYEALAHVRLLYDWKWSDAEREFKRAIEVNSKFATAHQRYALYLTVMGRMDEAIAEIKLARELDPLSLIINTDVGLIFYIAGQYDQAVEQCRAALEIDPNFGVAHFALGLAYEQKGSYEDAIAEFQSAVTLSGGLTVMRGALGHAYAVSGKKDDAHKVLRELDDASKQQYVSPYSTAVIHAGLGENDKVFAQLRQAYEQRSVWFIHLHLTVDPRLSSLHTDSRYHDLRANLGLST